MSVKANLKAAKAALDAGDYGKAVVEAQIVLASDSKNYFAQLFLARALEKQTSFDDAAKTYLQASKSKPDDSQAWLGLCSVYEAQGSEKGDEYLEAAVKAAEVFANADDKHRCQTTVDRLTVFVKQHGTQRSTSAHWKYCYLAMRFPTSSKAGSHIRRIRTSGWSKLRKMKKRSASSAKSTNAALALELASAR